MAARAPGAVLLRKDRVRMVEPEVATIYARQSDPFPLWGRVSLFLLATLIIVCPLPFGLVEPHRRPLIGLVAGLILLSWSLLAAGRYPGGMNRVAVFGGLALVLIAAFQIIPLPAAVISTLSPERAGLLERLRAEPSGLGAFASLLGVRGWLSGPSREALSAHPEATRRALLLLGSLLVVGTATALLSHDGRAARRLTLCIIAIGAFEALYGLTEYLSGHQHIFVYRKRHYIHSVTGTYINKNHFAGLMEISLPLAIGLYWDRVASLRRSRNLKAWLISMSDPRRGSGGLLLLAIGLMASALLLSFSRSGIAFCALATGGMLFWLSRGTRGSVPRAIRATAVVLVLIAPLAWLQRREIADSFAQLPYNVEEPGGRTDVWKATARMIGDYPLLGAGLGTFKDVFPHYATPPIHLRFSHAHNGYLELASGVGLPAALLGIAGIVWLLARGLRASASADAFGGLLTGGVAGCAALLMHELTDFNLTIPANALLFSICLGLVLGVSASSTHAPSSPPRRAPGWTRLVVAAVAFLMLVESGTEYLAADYTRRSRDLGELSGAAGTSAGIIGERLSAARKAVAWRPGDATAQRQRYKALAALARLRLETDEPPGSARPGVTMARTDPEAIAREMGTSVMAAIRANPWDAALYPAALVTLDLASRLRPEDQDLASASVLAPIVHGVFSTVVWLAPTWEKPHRAMADYLLAWGDLEGAAASYRRALELDPSQTSSVCEYVSSRVEDGTWIHQFIPKKAEPQRLYGDFMAQQGEIDRAEAAYLASLEAGENAPAVLHLHDLYLESGRPEQAQEVVRRALEESTIAAAKERAELHYALSRSLLRTNDRQPAITALESAVESDPGRLLFQVSLASLMAEQRPAEAVGRWSDLLDRYRASPELPHFRPDIYLALARAYEKEGRTLEALREYRHVLIDRPNDPIALGRIALLERGES